MARGDNELIGALIDDRYKVLESMASGSMGAVYKAERVPVGKLVAIKFLHASFAGDSEFQARFERETRVMSKLAHPNCVSVVDFGQWEGAPYLVMEYVAGTTLRAVLDDTIIEPTRALTLARQIAAGLAHAHAQGITHRDVKPANIMITEEHAVGEHVRILDFGLARLRGAVGRDATQTNVVVGTPNYMAPEQTIGGGTIDARTDVYAVGVVLFEMVAGDRPFTAEDTLALLGMHRAAPIPRLADRVPEGTELPEGLQAVIDKAMAKSPDDRYQSAVELVEAIDEVLGKSNEATRQFSRRKTDPVAMAPTMVDIGSSRIEKVARSGGGRRLGLALLVLLLLGGGAAAAWYVTHREEPPDDSTVAARPAATPPAPPSVVAADAPVAVVELDASSPADAVVLEDAEIVDDPDGGEIDMDPDPEHAEDPLPESDKSKEAEDEAEDAPKTEDEAEKVEAKKAPPAPQLAKSVAGAVRLARAGKRDLAIASLTRLRKQQPKNAYIPFLLGNLNYDRRWWGVAMEQYAAAIRNTSRYRYNATLIRNVIRMLASKRTESRATQFLLRTIGKPARPYLDKAAKSEQHPRVRQQALFLARRLR